MLHSHRLAKATQLSPSVKSRIKGLAPGFVMRTRSIQREDRIELLARQTIRHEFPSASPHELTAATIYLLGNAVLVEHAGGHHPSAGLDAAKDSVKNKLDSLSEMGEMESLRLQMAMDRLSKLMSTLSNLLKKASDTASGITQNLK